MELHALRNFILCAGCAVGIIAHAQTFEVATIKPVDPTRKFDPTHFWVHVTPAGASYWYMTPDNLVAHAYQLEAFQVTGGPDWAATEHFDIEARFPEGTGKQQEPAMLQTLLKDRFKLTAHIEQRQLDGFVLTVAKTGPKLKPSPADSSAPPAIADANGAPAKSAVTRNPDGSSTANLGKFGTQTIRFNPENSTMHFEESKLTMDDLAKRLSICLGAGSHKVTNLTGLEGTFQLAYDCPMPGPRNPATTSTTSTLPPDPADGSPLIRSLDALGLKLEKRKLPTDVYVIDHIEPPSAN
jgi:uncharacterized protein (TIGR03435 family)